MRLACFVWKPKSHDANNGRLIHIDAIDIHVHHPWRDPAAPRPDEALRKLKESAKQWGIGKVLLLTLAIDVSESELVLRNNTTLSLIEEDPDFYLGACYLSPLHEPEFIKKEAERCIRRGMIAIKQHMDAFADDPRQDLIAALAAEYDVPIVWHAWYKMAQKYPNESDASHIARLAKRNPRTRIVMAHMTGVGRRGIQDVADLPNVWVDTSGGYPESELLEYAVKHLGAERLVYGSDYGAGRGFDVQVSRIYAAELSEEQRSRILVQNAADVLKLSERQSGASGRIIEK